MRRKNPRPTGTIECMCLACHGPIPYRNGNSVHALYCRPTCRHQWTRGNDRNTYQDRRMLHAWRREQMAILIHVQRMIGGNDNE